MPLNQFETLKAVRSHLFVKIEVSYYKDTPSAIPGPKNLLFSDYKQTYIINNESYTGVGNLLQISSSSSELRTSSGELTIVLSGIPNSAIYEIVNSRIKGCPVTIYRAILDPISSNTIEVMNRYRGFVNNYSLQEDYDNQTRISTNSILLVCNSAIDVLQNKISGRKTSATSQKRFYPDDTCFDRVTALENTSFNFGSPQ